ncbi:MAG: hypothetical protein Q4C87_07135 [Actinomycetaceae bacterium]|nr:hypothetical protein [Actinomycetaceae bacterium]
MSDAQVRNAAVGLALESLATAANSALVQNLSEAQQARSGLTTQVSERRSVARARHNDVDELHKHSHEEEWRRAASKRAKSSVTSMLAELADLGFAWRDIARMLNVSVPAVQKWRKGEKASGANRMRIASLLAACDLVAKHYMVDEVASWFEMPLSPPAPVTPIILYAAQRVDLIFEFASGHVDPEALLSEFEPDWRERYRSDFELFEAGNGLRSIRLKD